MTPRTTQKQTWKRRLLLLYISFLTFAGANFQVGMGRRANGQTCQACSSQDNGGKTPFAQVYVTLKQRQPALS